MARWRVIAPHYIYAEQYGQPTEWAREETNRDTGRTFRKTMKVPLLVDPNDPTCCRRSDGLCVVARKGSEQSGDIVFEGPPTPDLEPLDEEAQALSDAERPKWKMPIDSLPSTTGEELASQMIRMFENQMNAINQLPQAQATSLAGAPASQIEELKALILAQQEQINKLASAGAPVDTEPSELVDIDPDALPTTPPPVAKPAAALRRGA